MPVSMTVMIVNPLQHAHRSGGRISDPRMPGHYEAETENIMFFPDQNDPVPNRYYEVQKQSYEESLQDLDSRIEKADESEKASLRDNREQIQGFLDELENQRMSVTEEMIQAYREQVAPYLYVTPPDAADQLRFQRRAGDAHQPVPGPCHRFGYLHPRNGSAGENDDAGGYVT